MKDQKELVREINEKKIIEAAERVFACYGFKGATTDKISKQSALPKANIHYYFKTKANLYHQVLAGILSEWMDSAQAFDHQEEPRQALTQYVESKMEFSRLRPYASKVWANEMLHGAPIVSEFLKTTLKNWLDDRVKVIQGWIDCDKINPVDPIVFIYMIWSVTQHYADFERQVTLLNNGNCFTDEEYKTKTEEVVKLILTSVGL
jgi:TetR/AcrR family transcriptional regulator